MDDVRPLNEELTVPPSSGEENLTGKVRAAGESEAEEPDGIKLGLPVEVEG